MVNKKFRILIVDDEPDYCEALETILRPRGYHVRKTIHPTEVEQILSAEEYDLVLTDLIMPEMDGINVLQLIKDKHPMTHVIMMTANGTIENAVNAMKLGAFHYIIKGGPPEILLSEIETIRRLQELILPREKQERSSPDDFSYMMDSSNRDYQKVLDIARKAAVSDSNILILGESGSGKEVIAQFIHRESQRSKEPFIDINCYALSDSLIESELFGHEKGSFTGATVTRIGRFEAAKGGTLFLDEIGDIPLSTQSKILKSIESKKIQRVGKNEPISVNFRLISATNKDLQSEIREGHFREDLFYRLSTITIVVPPLRRRKEDLDKLIGFFIKKTEEEMNLRITRIEQEVMHYLHTYDFPGNVRELKNTIERLVVLSENGVISVNGLMVTRQEPDFSGPEHFFGMDRPLRDIRSEFESRYIEYQLRKNNRLIGKTAELLGISRRQLFNKMLEYGLK